MTLDKKDIDALNWGKENIIWAGNANTNFNSRRGRIPLGIVDHISEGSLSSLISWFTSSENAQSSANFGVGVDGKVLQFVRIEDRAWANGRMNNVSSKLVKSVGLNVNPNDYTVSIEHEGVFAKTKGLLSTRQLESTINLHAYIIAYVKKVYNHIIVADREHIIGHFEIDAINKVNCPGYKFPFNGIIEVLTGKYTPELIQIPFIDIKTHWAAQFIADAYNNGIVSGDGSEYFHPDKPCTRAEMVTMIMHLYNKLKQ